MPTNERVLSRDVSHLREDLTASLAFALGEDRAVDIPVVESIVADVKDYGDVQEALHCVRILLGTVAFGRVTLFHLAAGTSLRNASEFMTHSRSLEDHGLTVYDLAWPPSQLKDGFLEHAVEDFELERQLEIAVAAWRLQTGA